MNQVIGRMRGLPAVLAASAFVASSFLAVAPSSTFAASGSCPITVSEQGSTTVYPALQAAQSAFQAAGGCTLNLVANGSGAGLTALLADTVQVAASSRVLNSGNETNNLYAWQIGGDAMVMAVQASWANAHSINHINMTQVQGIYSGTITKWNQIDSSYPNETIIPRSRITTSGTYSDLLSKFGINATAEANTIAATGLPRFTTSQDEADAACGNPDQLVYTSLANLQAFGPSGQNCLVALAMASGSNTSNYVMPSVTTVQNGTYPVPRQLFLAVNKFGTLRSATVTDNSSYVKAYDLVNYFLSSAGQQFIGQVGFVNQAVPTAQPIPDYDVNLDGAVGLGDLGNITGRWGQTSSCNGWIRADVNNDGAIGLADIGKVTAKWGQVGFVAPN
jgi:phosphate transport system substrate-binding protein